jgi:hypothetical protein
MLRTQKRETVWEGLGSDDQLGRNSKGVPSLEIRTRGIAYFEEGRIEQLITTG